MRDLFYIILLVWVIFMVIMSFPTIPRCNEDAVLIGTGEFSNGQWSQYICGPSVDDYNVQ